MSETKGLGISKEQVIKMAKARAMKYLIPPKTKKLTPKERKAAKIHEMASKVGGCQMAPLMKLLDELTGLPVSKSRPERLGSQKVSIDVDLSEWCKKHKLKIFRGSERSESLYIVVGHAHSGIVMDTRGSTCGMGGTYGTATKDDVDRFYLELGEEHLGHIVANLLE